MPVDGGLPLKDCSALLLPCGELSIADSGSDSPGAPMAISVLVQSGTRKMKLLLVQIDFERTIKPTWPPCKR